MPAWGESTRDEDSWKLVLFIRHLPKITPGEIREMERQEEKEEEEFLRGEEPKKQSAKPHH